MANGINVLGINNTFDIADDIKQKNPITPKGFNQTSGFFNNTSVASITDAVNKKQDSSVDRWTNVGREDAQVKLSTGEYQNKYPDYFVGTDNQERLAKTQTKGDKWANGLLKFGGKTLSAVAGGTYGVVNGIGAAISDGNITSLYDNEFANRLADLDVKMNYNLPNYYTKQEESLGVFGQMKTANFWADKFLGGLSFTAGALISEGLWAYATGGASLATTGARLGSKLRWGVESLGEANAIAGVSKLKSAIGELAGQSYKVSEVAKTTPILLGKAGEFASAVGFTIRSAGYEASVEALQYKKEAKENFYNNFEKLNGREPNQQDIEKFETELDSSANAVFGANIGIVGLSNFVTMGHILDIKNPIKTGLTEFIDKKAFGYGIEGATRGQKIARNTFDYVLKPGFTEGLFEEGLQGVTQKFGNKWIEHTYNPKYTTETFNSINAMGQSLAEQYGTDAGWKENILGVLIGVVGGSVNVRSEREEKENTLKYKEAVGEKFSEKTLQSLILPFKVQTANRIAGFSESARENEQQGNIVKSELDKKSSVLTFINAKQVLGESISDTTKEMKNALDKVSPDAWKEIGVEPENIEQEKQNRLKEFTDLAKQWKTNKTYWQYIIGSKLQGEQNLKATALEEGLGSSFSKNAQIVEALAWQSTIGENAHTFMTDTKETIAREMGDEYAKSLNLKTKLSTQSQKLKEQLVANENRYNNLISKREELTQKIAELDDTPNLTGDKEGLSPRVGMSAQLLRIEKQISDIQTQSEEIARQINVTSDYSKSLAETDLDTVIVKGDTISGDDLLNIKKNLNQFKNAINGYDLSNPQKARYINDLIDEYDQAEKIFLESQATQKVLASKDFKMENIGGWISNKLKNKKAMNENTQEWLQNAIDTYSQYKTKDMAQEDVQEAPAETETDLTKTQPPTPEEVEVEAKSEIEQYKDRIEGVLKNYDMLYVGENYDGVANAQPTDAEIEEYKKQREENNISPQLEQKLKNWKLLDSAVDSENTSVADLVKLIQQLESEIAEQDTKDEVTETEAFNDLRDDIQATGNIFRPDLGVNVTAPVTIKLNKKTGNYELTHVKARYIVEQIGQDYVIEGKGKDIDNLKPGDSVITDGMTFKMLGGGRLEFKKEYLDSRYQQLNMYIAATNTVDWSFTDIYSIVGDEFIKMPSQFKEFITPEESYNIKKGDRLTLHIKDLDGWNRTKEGDNKEQLKIFLRDERGNDVQTLKGEKLEVGDAIVPNFSNIRQEAYSRWEKAGKPTNMDLGISVEVDGVFLGSAELTFSDGRVVNSPISKEAAQKVIIAKGYILNGEITLDNEIKDVDKTFVGQISKNNQGKKQPIIVFRKGAYNIAFPISMVKTNTPVGFDNLLVGTPQEIVLKINDEIIKNGIQAPKLTYKDVQIVDGEISLSDRANVVRDAFVNKKSFVSADTLASKTYKKENLTTDATINIDLDNLDRAISSPKIRIKLDESVNIRTEADVKIDNLIDTENKLNDLAVEIYDDFIKNADTKYLDSKGDIIEDTTFTDTFDENTIEQTDNQIKKVGNINILKKAFADKLSKSLETAIGAEKVLEVRRLLKQYDFIKSQTPIKDNDGKKNICN